MKKKQYKLYEHETLLGIYTAEEASKVLGVGIDTVRHSIASERKIKKNFYLVEVEGKMSDSRRRYMEDKLKEWDEVRAIINPYALGLEISPEEEERRQRELLEILENENWNQIRKRLNPHATGL